jgi:putative DNA primase/helicase
METKYQSFATVAYRFGANHDPAMRRLAVPKSGRLAYVWKNTNDPDGTAEFGLGYPVVNSGGETINFLKMHVTGSLFLKGSKIVESLLPGLPIADGRVEFGSVTTIILITLDCHTGSILNRATGLFTCAVLYTGNIRGVCKELLEKHPKNILKICLNGDGTDEDSYQLYAAQNAVWDMDIDVFASGQDSFRSLLLKSGAETVCEALNSKKAVKTWDLGEDNKDLKILGSAVPWPHSFDGEVLLQSLILRIRQYVSITDNSALLVGLWIMHTYLLDATRFTPMLAIVSSEHETGKSTLLAVLHLLCRNAYRTSQISTGQLLTLGGKTVLFDDGDSILGNQAFVNILNISHDRLNGGITTVHKSKLVSMQPFFAKVVKLHIDIPDSLALRSIPINLHRKKPDENLEHAPDIHFNANDEFAVLRSQIARWTKDHVAEVTELRSMDFDLGSYTLNSTYLPLFAIAQCISGDVFERAVNASKATIAKTVSKSEKVQLLENIREILVSKAAKNIPSIELVEALCNRRDWPWNTCKKGKPLDQVYLAEILKGYGVHTLSVWIDGSTKRGFRLEDFEDAFARYLPPMGTDVEAHELLST